MVLTGLAANYILSYKSKELLQKVVSNVTKDAYRLDAEKVTIFYKHAGISGNKINLVPIGDTTNKATISLEKVEIRLESLWNLLWNRKLEVKTIEFIKPALTAYAKKKTGSAQKGISETINEIQLKLFEIIDVLNVKNVTIEDAALKIYGADEVNNSFLSITHVNLTLKDILILPSTNDTTPQIKLTGSLTLLKPDIHLPSDNISAKVGKLSADISNTSLAIDELDFSITSAENKTQKLTLSSIDISHFNWDRFLKEGLIELDSVVINKGTANISLSQKENKNETQKTSGGYKGTSIIVHHTFISDISYQFNNQRIKNGVPKEISLNLLGDSMYLKEFTLTNGKVPAFDVEKLGISIKNVEESDDEKLSRFTLGALSINNKSLVLKNYLLETNEAIKDKNYFRLAIPELRLENYSLDEIFQKRLAASKIYLINPDITIDIRKQKEKDQKTKQSLDAVFSDLMVNISNKATLEEIAIENGNFTILPTLSPEDKITVSGLSLIMDAAKFPAINDAHDFINAIKRLDSKGFVLKGKNMELVIREMELLKIPRGIHFGSIVGNLGNGKIIDLKGVSVLINDSISNYRRKGDFHASAILVESGIISLDLIKKDGNQKTSGNAPKFLVDTLNLKNVVFDMQQGETLGVSAALNIVARDFIFQDKEFYWSNLGVNATNPDADFGETSFNAGSLNIIQPGIIQIRNASGSNYSPNASIDFSTKELDISLGLYSTNFPTLKVDAIEMTKPALKIAIRQQDKVLGEASKTGKAINKDISLTRILLTEPSVDITVTDKEGKQVNTHKVFTGSLLLEDIHTINQPELSVGKIKYKTTNPTSDFNGLKIHPSALQLSLSDIKYNTITKHFRFHVDAANVENITHTIYGKKNDTIQIDAGEIGMSNFDYAKGDSVSIDKFLYHTNWWLKNGNVKLNTPQKSIAGWKINVSGNKSINMMLDSFAIINQLSKEAVWQSTPYEQGYETITGGKLALSDIRLQVIDKKPSVQIGKMATHNLHFTTIKDKTKLEDTISYRPMLTQMFTRIPLPLKIDSLLLNNARVDAHEISKKTGKETHIFFTEANGYIKNVKTWDVKENDTLDTRVRARFFGTDPLRLHFKQSYDDTLQGFWMRVRMSHFNLPEMNQLLTPLMGLKIESGTIDSLLLVAKGNDYFAYGTMDLRFHDLHAKIAVSEDSKGKWLTTIENFFIDLILPNHDNGHTDLLYKERLRKRGIFNFWAKIGLEGLLTNLGIKSDKKERKKFEESLEKFNLPEKYWDEIDDW